MRLTLVPSLLFAALVGCSSPSDEPEPRDDGGSPLQDGSVIDASLPDGRTPDGGNRPDSGPGNDGGPTDSGLDAEGGALLDGGGPGSSASILSRASLDTHVCSVSKALINYKPISWGYTGHALSRSGGSNWLARVQAEAIDNPFHLGPASFVVSQVDAQGKLGTSTTISVSDPDLVSRPALVPLEQGAFALLWYELASPGATMGKLRFATVGADGTLSTSPKSLVDINADTFGSLRAARAATGQIAVVWNAAMYSGTSRLQLALFDATGQTLSAPRTLSDTALAGGEIVPSSDGFAVAYQTLDRQSQRAEAWFVSIALDGTSRAAPQALTMGSPLRQAGAIGWSRMALLAVGPEFLTGWSEGDAGNGDFSNPGGAYRVLRIARLDGAGNVLASALIRDKSDDIDEDEPVLTHFGDDAVALSWGRADHIYICAGCVPNHTLETVLIDPRTLTPRSNVAKVQAPMGGLLGKRVLAQGDTLLSTMEITFHVHSEPGFAAVRCLSK